MKNSVTLRTPFKIQNFESIEEFIMTIFPDLKSYLQKQLTKGIQKSDLANLVYPELERNLELYIVRNYSKELDNYLLKEASHTNKEAMKEVLLSSISITLSVRDTNNNKLSEDDYLVSLRNTINKIDL
jgi:hypothetical protein